VIAYDDDVISLMGESHRQ